MAANRTVTGVVVFSFSALGIRFLQRERVVDVLQPKVNRFNGEGLPYCYGFVAFDTNKQEVVRAVVDQLW